MPQSPTRPPGQCLARKKKSSSLECRWRAVRGRLQRHSKGRMAGLVAVPRSNDSGQYFIMDIAAEVGGPSGRLQCRPQNHVRFGFNADPKTMCVLDLNGPACGIDRPNRLALHVVITIGRLHRSAPLEASTVRRQKKIGATPNGLRPEQFDRARSRKKKRPMAGEHCAVEDQFPFSGRMTRHCRRGSAHSDECPSVHPPTPAYTRLHPSRPAHAPARLFTHTLACTQASMSTRA